MKLKERGTNPIRVSRRNFLGTAAAAPLAAPSIVKSIAEGKQGLVGRGTPVSLLQASPDDNPESLMNSLRSLIRDRTEAAAKAPEVSRLHRDLLAQHRIDGLRSVSLVNKMRMVAEDEARREKEDNLRWLEERIAQIKRQLGPLGAAIE